MLIFFFDAQFKHPNRGLNLNRKLSMDWVAYVSV